MSRWYCIPPANYLDMMQDWTYHMIIAPHAIGNDWAHKKYFEFYRDNEQLHTIIDNGLWEGHVVDNERLLRLAQVLHANEIVAPDSKYGKVTLKRTKEFMNYIKKEGQRDNFKIHGVVHGGNIVDQIDCLNGLIALGVDIIDIPKWFGAAYRTTFLNTISTILYDHNIDVHYLGHYKEEMPILQGKEIFGHEIRSFDTSVPFKPDYSEKFQLDLPDSWWIKQVIKRRVNKYKRLYK